MQGLGYILLGVLFLGSGTQLRAGAGGGEVALSVQSAPDGAWARRSCENLRLLAWDLDLAPPICRPGVPGSVRLSLGPHAPSLTLEAQTPAEAQRAVAEAVDQAPARSGETHRDDPRPGEVLFAAGLPFADRLALLPEGRYLDLATGEVLDFEAAREVYRRELPREVHTPRALAELSLALGVGIGWYVTEASLNAKDWQYDTLLDGFTAKFVTFEGWRFDDNRMWLNSPGHVVSGGIYYLVGRSNGFGAGGAAGMAAATSAAWELVVEHRELASIGDLVLGSFGATALGESLYQLGGLFADAAPVPAYRLLATLFDFPSALNRGLEGGTGPPSVGWDAAGLPRDRWRRLALSFGAADTVSDDTGRRDGLAVGFEAEVIPVPAWGRPVTRRRWITQPARTRLDTRLVTGDAGVDEFRLGANAMLAGRHDQVLREEDGDLSGHALLLGLATDWRQESRDEGDFVDRSAVVGLLGPALTLDVFTRGVRVTFDAEAYPDFALIKSRALPAFARQADTAALRTVLRDQGYYYALGATLSGSTELSWRGVFGGTRATWQRFSSIDRLDRYDSGPADAVHLTDGILEQRFWAGVRLAPFGRLRVALEERVRRGRLDEVRVERRETRILGEVVADF